MSNLIVDLDGSFIETDSSFESFWSAISINPIIIAKSFVWLFKGIPFLKYKLFKASGLNISSLPINKEVVEIIHEYKKQNKKVFLFTGATHEIAAEICRTHTFFDDFFASDKSNNLVGKNKLLKIREFIGDGPFDYIGNSSSDIPIWNASKSAYIVSNTKRFERKIKNSIDIFYLNSKKNPFDLFKVIRPYQWAKNLLVFVPFLIYEKSGLSEFLLALTCFLSLSFVASAVYVLNDLLDLSSDRDHPTKKNRPFAKSTIDLSSGVWLIPTLLIFGFYLASLISLSTFVIIAFYFFLTTLYSFLLKRKAILDILTLAILYTLRLIAGAFSIQNELVLSPWLISFSLFFFFFLACVKRQAELNLGIDASSPNSRRSYFEKDKDLLSVIPISSGLISCMILLLYANEASTSSNYSSPFFLWFLVIIFMYWISRICLINNRGLIKEDPLLFALKDKPSILVAFLGLSIILAAKYISFV